MAKTKTTKDPLAELKIAAEESDESNDLVGGGYELAKAQQEHDELVAELEELEAAEAEAEAARLAGEGRERGGAPPDAPSEEEPPLEAAPAARNPLLEMEADFKGSWGAGTIRLKKGQRFRWSRFGGAPGLLRLEKAGAKFKLVED